MCMYIYLSGPRTRSARSAFPFWRSAFQNEIHAFTFWVTFCCCFFGASKCVFNNMSLTFAAFWFCVLGASETQIQFHGEWIVTPLSRMTTLVLQISTPPVQFDIVFFGHVLELRPEYVLNTLLITRPSRFAAFWSHVLEFTCVSSFWPAHRPFSNLGDFAWESLSACVLVTFWLRSEHVLEPGINKFFLVPRPCVNSSWMATTSAAAAVAAAEFLLVVSLVSECLNCQWSCWIGIRSGHTPDRCFMVSLGRGIQSLVWLTFWSYVLATFWSNIFHLVDTIDQVLNPHFEKTHSRFRTYVLSATF